MISRRFPEILLGTACLLLAAPLGADWLVTRDGGRVETDGPWTVKGRQVVFTLPSGTLASLRLDDVDLEASEAATAEVATGAKETEDGEPAMEESASPIAVITNDSLGPASAPPSSEAASGSAVNGDGEDEEEVAPGTMRATAPFKVLHWRSASAAGRGWEVTGTVQNAGTEDVKLGRGLIRFEGEGGGKLAESVQLFFAGRDLSAGASTKFRALFGERSQLVGSPFLDVQVEANPSY